MGQSQPNQSEQRVRDRRRWASFAASEDGNVATIFALMVLPMIAMIGSGVEYSRYYMTKSRLQQACDAGVLAGRKAMGTADFSEAHGTAAASMFDANFPANFMGATATTRSFTADDERNLNGTASATLPTVLMSLFGYETMEASASCTGTMNYGATDIMFVLDTTGSMRHTNSGDAVTRIVALQNAVMEFDSTLTEANATDSPIRYGFVPYSQSVNVGRLLHQEAPEFLASQGRAPYKTNYVTEKCGWTFRGYRCVNELKTYIGTLTYDVTKHVTNGPGLQEVTGTIVNPAEATDKLKLINQDWTGCIIETMTVANSFAVVPAGAVDHQVASAPGNGVKPWLPLIPTLFNTGVPTACPKEASKLQAMTAGQVRSYVRGLTPNGFTEHDIGMIWGTRLLLNEGIFAEMNGTEYKATDRHLIFMTDGQMDADDKSLSCSTDRNSGRMTAYGIETFDRRVMGTTENPLPAGVSCSSTAVPATELNRRRTSRLVRACETARANGVTVWVIGFGVSLTPSMYECAGDDVPDPGVTPDEGEGSARTFAASNSTELNEAFRKIAERVAALRLVQ